MPKGGIFFKEDFWAAALEKMVVSNGCSMKKTSFAAEKLLRNRGLDNIGVVDRSQPFPNGFSDADVSSFNLALALWKPWETMGNHDWSGGMINQSDGTSWMAFYSLKLETHELTTKLR